MGNLQSSPKQPRVCTSIWVRRQRVLSWCQSGSYLEYTPTHQCRTHSCPPGLHLGFPPTGPKAATPGLCPGSPSNRKSPTHTYLTFSLPKLGDAHSRHKGLSHTRPILQNWQSGPFQLIHRAKHRKLYKVSRQRNILKITEQEKAQLKKTK